MSLPKNPFPLAGGRLGWGWRREAPATFEDPAKEFPQLKDVLHEPCEDQAWLYMVEIPEPPGCRAWTKTANMTLVELSTVAAQLIFSYMDRGNPLPA